MPNPRVEGFGARQAALRMLDSVLRRGQTLAASAAFVAGGAAKLAPADQALAVAIAGETLRRLPDLDAWIDSATQRPLPDDSKARMVLRIALAQKIGLGTPDHAVVATALPQVEGGPRRLVHGVLGTLLRGEIPDLNPPRLPSAVESRWAEQWGADMVAASRRQIASRPALDLSFADDGAACAFAEQAGGKHLAVRSVRIDSGNVADLPGYGEGRWWVQDLAASLPARLVPAGAGAVIDLCAAPGGKTMQLAAAGHDVIAVDMAGDRLERLAENLQRTELRSRLVTGDALLWKPEFPPAAILLDSPCSATGTFRRHPEVLYRARPAIIGQSVQLQSRLLDRCARWLEPGGTLVYAVCSLERAEGEDAITAFLNRVPGFRIDPPRPGELPDFVPVASEGWVRIVPGLFETEGGLDGFFIARLVRTA
ncbi:MAG: transcription antitermination factor NusB [Sphingomicrobium sp.]